MVNSTDFGIRIQKVMDFYALSASSFADHMGVGRSSISHILSGRNKPSLDFVMKIIETYTDVDLEWLLYGRGAFPQSTTTSKKNEIKNSLHTEVEKASSLSTSKDHDLFSQSTTSQEEENISSIASALSSETKAISTIDRIVIFYADGTFTSYEKKNS
ncbi:helix-turn-helix transcriptional regulator [Aquimarina sp. U1-2]|uniref:helix-turn-helix domain-containing protein n=1 Tax=Aquimarina sp. U1-2 TaxID=2823141 RepID=UPI001AECC3F8|nr:helix-turn-helix transcriptional regulator [Aquimarina sp. U1-2]MBP2831960.1 helix-turn-helix transcriptional regulator [Aquimarina sp. U1-2]